MELFSYIFLSLFLLINIIIKYNIKIKNNLTVFFILSHILIVRMSGLDGDMSVYLESLGQDRSEFYYQKEFIFWFLLDIFNIYFYGNYVFIAIDIFMLLIVLEICKLIKIHKYYSVMFYIAFFSILGHQNIYRQWVAGILFLYLILKDWRIIYAVSFVHNSFALVATASYFSKKISMPLFIIISISFIFVISLFMPAGYKEVDTGSNNVLILILMMIFNLYIINRSKLLSKNKLLFFFFLMMIILIFSFNLSSSFIERLIYIYLQLIMPFTILSLAKKSNIYAALYCFILIIPSFFTSVLLFIY